MQDKYYVLDEDQLMMLWSLADQIRANGNDKVSDQGTKLWLLWNEAKDQPFTKEAIIKLLRINTDQHR